MELTDDARRVLPLAREEARRLGHNYIGTEHLLLAIVREDDGLGAKVLASLDIDLGKVRSEVEYVVGRRARTDSHDIELSPRATAVILFAVDEARALKHDRVGTEHLLLGLLRANERQSALVLHSLGASAARVRDEVLRMADDAPQSS
jgi:ATP-dependent Clp protease ATP-binding subunit ClpC